jgi:hypothetical protein
MDREPSNRAIGIKKTLTVFRPTTSVITEIVKGLPDRIELRELPSPSDASRYDIRS